MMEHFDEELQKAVESGQMPVGPEEDITAYQHVFRALAKDPGYALPPGFAEKVAASLPQKGQEHSKLVWIGYAAGLVFMTVAAIFTGLMTGLKLHLGFFKEISSYTGLVIVAAVLIAAVQWLDHKLVTERIRGGSGG